MREHAKRLGVGMVALAGLGLFLWAVSVWPIIGVVLVCCCGLMLAYGIGLVWRLDR